MKPRLLLLVAIAAGLAIYFASAKSRNPTSTIEEPIGDSDDEEDRSITDALKITLDKLPLPGREPAEPADVAVQLEVDRSRGKNRIYFTLSERHGYYVEQFRIGFGWKKGGLDKEQYFDRYIKANETLRLCLEVVPAELAKIGGDMGTSEDWDAEVSWHGRARERNPDPLPPDKDLGRCD